MISDDKRPSLTMGNIKALIRSIKDYVNKKLKDLDIDTSLYAKQSDMAAVQAVIPSNASASNKLVTASDTGLYAKQSDMNAVQAVIPSNASASNQLATESDIFPYKQDVTLGDVLPAIKASADAVANYKMFSGDSQIGIEGSWFGYKRTSNYWSCEVVTGQRGMVIHLIYDNGTYTQRRII